MWHDVRLAARMLVKDYSLAMSAVAVLALGIAATNTVFTIANAVVIRDLPFEDPDRLVEIGTRRSGRTTGVSYLDLQDLRGRSRAFDGVAGVFQGSMSISGDEGAAERLPGGYVSADMFSLIGEQPILGRPFTGTDEQPGAPPVVMLGHSVWQRRYGGDAAVVGQQIRVNRIPATVIGVMPEGFKFPIVAEVWQPLTSMPRELQERRGARALLGVGRLQPGMTREQARQELAISMAALGREHPMTNSGAEPVLGRFRPGAPSQMRTVVYALAGAVGFLLLISCANVANLLLARAADRGREISLRVALGASRWQVVRQLLIEGVLLAAVAGAIALPLSLAGVAFFNLAVSGSGAPYWLQFTVDMRVLGVFAGVCLGTAVLFSLVPALHASRPNVNQTLHENGRTTAGTRRARQWAGALVVVQLALAPVLLMGGALMLVTLVSAYQTTPGISIDGLARVLVSLDEQAYPTPEQRRQFVLQLEERLSSTPTLRATLASQAPLEGADTTELAFDGRMELADGARPTVSIMTIGRGYFDVLGVPLVAGRDFLPNEGSRGETPAIVNARFAALHFDERSPLGARVRLSRRGLDATSPGWVTIIGVAPNIRQRNAADPQFDPVVYVPYASNPLAWASILARSNGDLAPVLEQVRAHVRALDRDLPLFSVETVEQILSQELFAVRVFGSLFAIFAGIAVVTSVVGVYAVSVRSVAQRTREIGIRIALGARAKDIWWVVSRRSAIHLAIALVIGIPAAAGLGRVLRGMTPLSSADPALISGVAILLGAVALGACVVPARRAIRLDPVATLRAD